MTNHGSRAYFLGRLKEIKVEEFLFYFAFTLFSIAEVVDTTAFTERFPVLSKVCQGLLCLAVILLLARLLFLRESGWLWTLCFVGFGLSAVVFYLNKFDVTFWIFLFIFAGKGADLKKLAKISLVVVSAITVISILACYAGFVQNYSLQAYGDRAVRYATGFKHPNRLAERIAEICIAYWYLNTLEHRWRVTALNLAAFVFVFFVAGSRGSCAVFIALILATFLYPCLRKLPKFSSVCSLTVIVAIALISFYLMVNYSPYNAFLVNIDNRLSGRLNLMNASYEYSGLTLFGTDFSHAPVVALHYLYGTDVHFLVDNAYARIVLYNGVIPAALFFSLVVLIYGKAIKEREFSLALLGITVIFGLGFVENFMLDIQYNYFLFMASDALFAIGSAKNAARRSGSTRNGSMPRAILESGLS